jgi:AsmA protein
MRKRIIAAVALALSGILVLAVLNVNFLVRRNKDYLIGRLEQALGRKITVDTIEVTLSPVGARLVNFAMPDDPAFSADAFLLAKDLRVDLRLLPLLIGQFRFKRLVLESPLITIVRDARGKYNFASSARNEKNEREKADDSKTASAKKPDSLLFLIASMNVSDGTLRYRDLKSSGELTATQINLKVNDFEWDEPFDVELEAAVMAAKPNLKFKSRLGPIGGNADYRNVPLDGDIHVDALDLGKVNAVLPQFRKALPRALRFDGVYTIDDLKFKGPLNNLSLKGAVTGTDASFRFE